MPSKKQTQKYIKILKRVGKDLSKVGEDLRHDDDRALLHFHDIISMVRITNDAVGSMTEYRRRQEQSK